MKHKVQFGKETRFDVPIRRAMRIRPPLLQHIRLPLCVLAMAGRSRLIPHRFNWIKTVGAYSRAQSGIVVSFLARSIPSARRNAPIPGCRKCSSVP